MNEMESRNRWRVKTTALGEQIVGRIDALAAISESPAALTRIFFTEHRGAGDLILRWMEEAGLPRVWTRSAT